jgi:pantetheine-phosphate adenylyltransferase
MRVCVGGTFFPLHKGHKELLKKAFHVAGRNGSVFIGLTSAAMAKRKGVLNSYQQRKQSVEQFLSEEHLLSQACIKRISTMFGPTLTQDFDVIIVSPETKSVAEEINIKRRQKGKKPLRIVVVPFILSEDKKPISSSRIRRREIDENGSVLKKE